jgi:hypothetical protein
MRGDLSDVSAADACRLLAGKGAGGSLLLEGPDGPGTIVFEGGRIVAASSPSRGARLGDRLVGAGYLDEDGLARALDEQRADPAGRRLGAVLVEGGYVPQHAVRLFVQEQVLDALFEIVRWRYGSFEVASDAPSLIPEVGVALSVDEALVETARRQREWEELSQVIPDLDAVPVFASGATSASAGLEADEFAVLASIDGERTIRELADDLGYGEFEAARIVYALTLLGIVEIELPEDEIGAALEDALLGAPWDTDPLVSSPADQVAAWEREAQERAADEPAEPATDEPAEPAVGDAAPSPTADDTSTEVADDTEVVEPSAHEDVEVVDAAAEPDVADADDVAPPASDVPDEHDPGAADGPAPWEFFPEPASAPTSQLPPPPAAPAPPASEPAPASGDDAPPWEAPAAAPSAPSEPVTVEADLPGPSYSDVIGELHRIGDRSADAPPAPSEPTEDQPPEEPADAPPPAGQEAGEDPAPAAPAAPPSGDVHEFLRELSRLALDEDVDVPTKPPPARREHPADDNDDDKRKRRGIFGWGG